MNPDQLLSRLLEVKRALLNEFYSPSLHLLNGVIEDLSREIADSKSGQSLDTKKDQKDLDLPMGKQLVLFPPSEVEEKDDWHTKGFTR